MSSHSGYLDRCTPAPTFLAISGCSSSGEMMLAHILSEIFPSVKAIVHQDEFFKPKSDSPIREFLEIIGEEGSEVRLTSANTDCREAVDFEALDRTLEEIRKTGFVPVGEYDRNKIWAGGDRMASLVQIKVQNLEELKRQVVVSRKGLGARTLGICLVEWMLNLRVLAPPIQETIKSRRLQGPLLSSMGSCCFWSQR